VSASEEFSVPLKNTTTPRVFIAATRQNDGKTTASLGLLAALQNVYPRIGYIKPVGQYPLVKVFMSNVEDEKRQVLESVTTGKPIKTTELNPDS